MEIAIKEIADLYIEAIGKIEFYWNFYTITLIALMGWFVSTKTVLNSGLKLLITVGYIAFVFMNISALWGSYTFADALRKDFLAASMANSEVLQYAKSVLAGRSMETQKYIMLAIHAVLGLFVLSILWFVPFGSRVENSDQIREKAIYSEVD